jgi:hypothetical protein
MSTSKRSELFLGHLRTVEKLYLHFVTHAEETQ